MKTPMQEMLEWVRATLPMDLDWPILIEKKVKSLIPKEKEVMCEFASSCFDEINDHRYRNVIEVIDEHYNETFNTK